MTSLQTLAAKKALALADPEASVSIAWELLEHGYDSKALRQLAGLHPSALDKSDELLAAALEELAVPLPPARDAVIWLAQEIAGLLLRGAVDEVGAARAIWDLTLRLPAVRFPELDTFIYAASEWDDRPEDRDLLSRGVIEAARALVHGRPVDSSGRV
jgi:hypothetical protein